MKIFHGLILDIMLPKIQPQLIRMKTNFCDLEKAKKQAEILR